MSMENKSDLSPSSSILEEIEKYRQKNVKLFYKLLFLAGICEVLFFALKFFVPCNSLHDILFLGGYALLIINFFAQSIFFGMFPKDERKGKEYIEHIFITIFSLTFLYLLYSADKQLFFPTTISGTATVLVVFVLNFSQSDTVGDWCSRNGKLTYMLWVSARICWLVVILVFWGRIDHIYTSAGGCSGYNIELGRYTFYGCALLFAPYLYVDVRYTKKYKEQIFPIIAEKLHYEYEPLGHSAWRLLISRELLFGKFKRDEHEDGFRGIVNGQKVAFEEVKIFSGMKESSRTFSGLLIAIEAKRRAAVPVMIHRKNTPLHRAWAEEMERIFLEDPEFDELFDVYSADQVKSRAALTPRFMESLKGITDYYGGKSVSACLYGNMVFITVKVGKNMFEPNPFLQKSGPGKSVEKILAQIELQTKVVESLG